MGLIQIPIKRALLGGAPKWTPLAWAGQGLACWYSPLFAPAGTNVTEVTGATGTGTTVAQSGNTLTGVATQFVKEVKVGDLITGGNGLSGNVTAIASATSLTLDSSATIGAETPYTITPVAGLSARVNRVFDQSGLGRHQDQATRSKMGALVASAYAGKPGFSMDGADDLFVNATAFLTGTSGAVFAVYVLTASIPNLQQTLLGSADEGTTTSYMQLLDYRNNAEPNLQITQQNAADSSDAVKGDTSLSAGVRYTAVLSSNGTAYGARVNGATQTMTVVVGANTGDWFGDTTLLDNVTLGGLKQSSEVKWLRGTLLDLAVIDGRAPTAADYAAYEGWAAANWP